MRLITLSSNKSSFRTVNFKLRGISLVVAEQKSPRSSQQQTYNAVGKSLMLALIHFCLGSSKNDAFAKYLKDWVFTLTVEVDGKKHQISRQADAPAQVLLDGEEIKVDKLRERLELWSFTEELKSPLSFRSVIRRFIRSGRGAYNEFAYTSKGDLNNSYGAMTGMAFLLGLDTELTRAKYELRQRQTRLKKTMAQLESDPLFSKLLAEDTVDIELMALKEDAARLSTDLSVFKVAHDYHGIEKEANNIKRGLNLLRRESVKLTDAIAQIDRSLKAPAEDLPPERVTRMYEEAQVALPEGVKRRLEEVVAFRDDLQRKRVVRLTQERHQLSQEQSTVLRKIDAASGELDRKLSYLSEHRALDEYLAVSKQLTEVQERIANLEKSRALRESVDREQRRIKREFAECSIQTEEYLESASALIEEATSKFRSMTKLLYGTRPSGLTVRSDDGENQIRYNIDAHISSDAAEGINEAKIFCFDMTLLAVQRNHLIRFLIHDSTLFSPVDPRQRLGMFKIADQMSRELDVQYIATLNLHDITSIYKQVDVEKEKIDQLLGGQNVVLKLTDDAPEEKLLGIFVDMDYTR